ncbi:MAG: sensor histidine kinase, partial [bacterium]
KELDCLYRISEIVEEPGITLDEILQKTAEAIPASWQFPGSTVCRITVDDAEYSSAPASGRVPKAEWVQKSDLYVEAERVGAVEVYYTDEHPTADEGPFLHEERRLIDAVAERLEKVIERVRAQKALDRERVLLSTVLDTLDVAIVICDEHARIIRFNETARRLHGIPETPVPSDQWADYYDLYAEDGITPLPTEEIPLFRAFNGEHVQNAEIILSPKGGTPRRGNCNGARLIDAGGNLHGAVIAMHDITERKESEERIHALVEEKERLLKEVQHRIKNTMNTMVSMLSLQADSLRHRNPDAATALNDAKSRFESMEVLYDQLYRTDSHESGSLRDYLNQLLRSIRPLFPSGETVEIHTDVDDIALDAKRLTTVGIIVNELVTNAMKYAFASHDAGTLYVTARHDGERITITVADNGPGLPDSFESTHTSSFGMTMIEALAAQLEGSIRFEQDGGVRATLEFPR